MHKSRSEQLFDYANKHATTLLSTTAQPWAIVPCGPALRQAWPLYSRRFREWLAKGFFDATTLYPGDHALNSAIAMLAAFARTSPLPAANIFTRLGHTGDPRRPDSIVLHLANENDDILDLVPHSSPSLPPPPPSSTPCRFLSSSTTLPLPYPIRTSVPLPEQLETLLDIRGPALHRIIVWLFSTFRPTAPYPALFLRGSPGSGKSTLARALRALVDPSTAPLIEPPKTERDLFNIALHNRVLAFDNLTRIPCRLRDAVARLTTGTGLAICGRNVFDEPQMLPLARPVIVTTSDATRDFTAPFTNNAIHVSLQPRSVYATLTEAAFEENLARALPSILGSLCDGVKLALSKIATTEFAPVSRFPAVHQWTAAAAPALGLTQDEINIAVAANPLVEAIEELLDDRRQWTGSPTELFNTLRARHVSFLPANPQMLSQLLNTTALSLFGIALESFKTNGERRIRVAHASASCVQEEVA